MITTARPDRILRFRRSERLLHWSIAIPFMICYVSAMALIIVYNPAPHRPYREVFSWIHRISGLCLLLFPTLTLARNRHDFRIHLYNIRQAWVWTLRDLKWLSLMILAAISKRVVLPEQGKFNAAEKLNFMMVMCTYPLYIVTGLLIWLPGVAFVSWVLHISMAAVATPLIVGHIFMATINPDTRVGLQGMISGFVDRQWAKHHYRAWYREHFESGRHVIEPVPPPVAVTAPQTTVPTESVRPLTVKPPARTAPAEPTRSASVTPPSKTIPTESTTPTADQGQPQILALISCNSCHAEHELTSWARLFRGVFAIEPVRCILCGSDKTEISVITEPQELEWILRQLDLGGAAQPLTLDFPGELRLPQSPVVARLLSTSPDEDRAAPFLEAFPGSSDRSQLEQSPGLELDRSRHLRTDHLSL